MQTTQTMQTIIMYHKFCRDGHCAAAIAHWYFSKHLRADPQLNHTIVYMPVFAGKIDDAVDTLIKKYCTRPGENAEEDSVVVYAFDLSFTYTAAKKLFKHFPTSFVYDHHISTATNCYTKPKDESREDFNAQLDIFDKRLVFDNDVCGAMLAFNTFFPNKKPPALVKYVQDRDLWYWTMPNSRAVSYGLYEMLSLNYYYPKDMPSEFSESLAATPGITFTSFNDAPMPDFTDWIEFMQDESWVEKAIENGELVNGITRKAITKLSKSGQVHQIGRHQVFVCNAGVYISELGEYLYKAIDEKKSEKAGHPIYICDYVLMWRYDHSQNVCYVSMRSRQDSDVNVQEIAEKIEYKGHKGGGHANAAGFETSITDLFKFIGNPINT